MARKIVKFLTMVAAYMYPFWLYYHGKILTKCPFEAQNLIVNNNNNNNNNNNIDSNNNNGNNNNSNNNNR